MTKVKSSNLKEISARLAYLNETELNWLVPIVEEILRGRKTAKAVKLKSIISVLPTFSDSQIDWLESVIRRFELVHSYTHHKSNLVNNKMLASFGDALLIHHSLSREPLSKDRFEYMLERSALLSGKQARIAKRGNPGHDLTIDNEKFSLKTQADASIRVDTIHISKFMELGHGKWGNDPKDLGGLRDQYLDHMKQYDRILTLRTLGRPPDPWFYELVEIPKTLLREAQSGKIEMRLDSKQSPKPGYCTVVDEKGNTKFQLYFDGGSERKLQIKGLRKELCIVHATWRIVSSEELL